MKATEQYFPVVLFIMLYKVALPLSLWRNPNPIQAELFLIIITIIIIIIIIHLSSAAILAAQFNTHWSLCSKYFGAPYNKELQ